MSGHIRYVIAISVMIVFVLFVSGCSGPQSPGTSPFIGQYKIPKNETELNSYYKITPATAKEWYIVAEREALNHSNDVVLYHVGGMQDDRNPLPANGKCREWDYDFYSPSQGKEYGIHVKAGVVSYVDYWSSNDSGPGIKDWNLDSDAVIIKANETFRQSKGVEPVGRADYRLTIGNATYDHHPIWDIIYDPIYDKGYEPQHYFRAEVDASTGAILSSTDSFNAL